MTKQEQINNRFIDKKYWKDIDIPAGMGDRSVYLYGGAGSGKTAVMFQKIKQLILKKNEKYPDIRIKNFFDVIKMVEFSANLKFAFNKGSDIGEIINYLGSVECLFVDDLGSEKLTPFVYEVFYAILDKRYSSELYTFLTSNYSLKDLQWGDRFKSRITEMCDIVDLGMEDKRINKDK